MTEMERIASNHVTISDKIRALNGAGYSRADIAKHLGRRYQQVRNVLKQDEIRAAVGCSAGVAQAVSPVDAPSANGRSTQEPLTPSRENPDDKSSLTDHSFALRPGLKVRFSLPSDLTAKEAQRLSSFLLTIPYT